jgi:hypothetical protein
VRTGVEHDHDAHNGERGKPDRIEQFDRFRCQVRTRVQVFADRAGPYVRYCLDRRHANKDRSENGQERHGTADNTERLALQDQIARDAAADRRQRREDQCPKQCVVALIGEHDAGKSERHGPDNGKNTEPVAVERLVDQHRQRVAIRDPAKLAAALEFVDCLIEARQHLRRLRRSAQHEMYIGGEAQRVLFDERTGVAPPRRRHCHDAIGDKAVNDPVLKIAQVLHFALDRKNPVSVCRIGDEGVHALVGIDEAGNDPELKLSLGEGVEHLLDCAERVSAAGTSRQNQNIGLRPIRLGEIGITAACFALSRARGDVRIAGGQRRQVIFPSYLRQGDFHVLDARKRALDFDVETGEDGNAALIVLVLIGESHGYQPPRRCTLPKSRRRIGHWRDGGLCGSDTKKRQPRNANERQ